VEMAGIEPASKEFDQKPLRAYPAFYGFVGPDPTDGVGIH